MAPRRLERVRHVRPQQLDGQPGVELPGVPHYLALEVDRLYYALKRSLEALGVQELNRLLFSFSDLPSELRIVPLVETEGIVDVLCAAIDFLA